MSANDLLTLLLLLIFSYIVGSVPFGVLLTKHTGKDIRKLGSGNVGTANVIRNFGWKTGFLVLFCDAFKGWLPTFLAFQLGWSPILVILMGILAIVGHSKSIFIGFKGGKGVATSLGMVIGIDWRISIICLCLWLAILLWTRYSSLGSLAGAFFAPILALVFRDNSVFIVFFSILTLAIFILHKENIKRLLDGKENQLNIFQPKKLATGLERTEITTQGCAEAAKFAGELKKATKKRSNWAFLVHPLSTEDLVKMAPNSRMETLIVKHEAQRIKWQEEQQKPAAERDPKIKKPTLICTMINSLGVRILGEGYYNYAGLTCYGMFVLVPYLPEQFEEAIKSKKEGRPELYDKIIADIKKAINLARQSGANYIGLGAWNSIITNAGALLEKDGLGPVTSGNALTAAGIIDGILKACYGTFIDPHNSVIAIIGATGSVGKPTALILAGEFKEIILAARDENKLQLFLKEIKKKYPEKKVTVAKSIQQAIEKSEVVVLAVSSTGKGAELMIDPSWFKPGALVCDASRPLVIPENFSEARKDVFFFEGAIYQFPGVLSCPEILRMGGPNMGFGCLMETIVHAVSGHQNSQSIGIIIHPQEVIEISQLAKKLKIKLAGFRFYGRKFALIHLWLTKLRAKLMKIKGV